MLIGLLQGYARLGKIRQIHTEGSELQIKVCLFVTACFGNNCGRVSGIFRVLGFCCSKGLLAG